MSTDWRAEFFEIEDAAYLNAAGEGPLPRVSVRAIQASLEWKRSPHHMPNGIHWHLPNRVRSLVARLINAHPDEIAITTGASCGLAAVANSLDWRPDDEILIAQGEFPAHFTTFLPLSEAGRLRVRVVQPSARFLAASDFIAQITARTRLVSASLVRFDNAACLDAVSVARACHSVGALLLLDVAQCAGAMPIDVAALEADFLTASGYKWLLSPFGTGVFWAREALIEQMPLGPFYWQAAENASKVHTFSDANMHVGKGAKRWDSPETASFLNLSGMEASLEFLLRVEVETVWQHNRKLIASVIERLPRDCCVLASPAGEGERGPFICIAARKPEETPLLFERLREAGVIVSLREGALRIAPHLYNSERDIDRLFSVLAV